MNLFYWKILVFIFSSAVLIQTCFAQWSKFSIKDSDDDKDTDLKKPYEFNDAEMTAIQAIVAFREVIGELLQKVGLNLPQSLASIITRSDSIVKTPVQLEESASNAKAGGMAAVLLRGLALSLPLLIPMATQMRRMSTDPYLPPLPFIPDPYYNTALHRRRGRSIDNNQLKQLENILLQIDSLSRKYNKH